MDPRELAERLEQACREAEQLRTEIDRINQRRPYWPERRNPHLLTSPAQPSLKRRADDTD